MDGAYESYRSPQEPARVDSNRWNNREEEAYNTRPMDSYRRRSPGKIYLGESLSSFAVVLFFISPHHYFDLFWDWSKPLVLVSVTGPLVYLMV
jgi:hypothetical protein